MPLPRPSIPRFLLLLPSKFYLLFPVILIIRFYFPSELLLIRAFASLAPPAPLTVYQTLSGIGIARRDDEDGPSVLRPFKSQRADLTPLLKTSTAD